MSSSPSNPTGASQQNPAPDLTNSGNPDNANPSSPAIIHVGDSYQDLGATITGRDADKNLGLKYFLNGALVSDILIDTSNVATDNYVATDPTGLTSTSTRTVIIEAAPVSPPPSAATSSSTAAAAATSTLQ